MKDRNPSHGGAHVSACGALALMSCCSLFVGAGSPASAAAARSTTVSVADLNLSTATGLQAARDRIHETARRLCEKVIDPWALWHQPDYIQCVNKATSDAVAQLRGPVRAANAASHAHGLHETP
jgi:UrcA family protein